METADDAIRLEVTVNTIVVQKSSPDDRLLYAKHTCISRARRQDLGFVFF